MTLHYVADGVWETNWKCLMENFMEGYHLSPLHRTTLHPVNPTKLCRHFPPGEAYLGYYAGFSPDLPRTTLGHPDLSEEEAHRCVMFAVPPALAVGGAADYSSFLCIQPETPDRVRVKQGLFFHGDHWTQDKIDHAVELFERTMAEDKEMLVDLKRGLHASRYASGPMAPADYEGPDLGLHPVSGPAPGTGAAQSRRRIDITTSEPSSPLVLSAHSRITPSSTKPSRR